MIDLMEKVQQFSQINKSEIRKVLQFVIGSLQKIQFSDTEWPCVKYHSFGSQGNGFGTTSSDIDLTLLTDHYTNEAAALSFIRNNFKQVVTGEKFRIIFINARVPLITIFYHGWNVDIIMNNFLGILNTKLLKSYSLLHERVKAGGILLKLWGKKYKVIRKSRISSYAMILMWICFLQRKHNLPDLQDQIYVSTLKQKQGDYMLNIRRTVKREFQNFKTDPRFIYHKEPLFKKLQEKCQNFNNIGIEQLLKQFWQYYTLDGEYFQTNKKISIHFQQRMNERFPLTIIDPFDHKNNPGKALGKKAQSQIFPKFMEASQKDIQETFKFLG